MAHGAAGGEAHPDGDGGVRAVHGVAEDELLIDAAAFTGGDVAAIEPGGYLLIHGGIGQEIAGELPDGELIVGKVLVEGANHPVAVGPHAAFVVEVQAVGVCIAGGIEPEAAHVLAIAFGFQEAGDDFFIGVGCGVGDEGIDLCQSRWQAGEVQCDAADEGFL